MSHFLWLGVLTAFTSLFTALAKIYKFGPYLEEDAPVEPRETPVKQPQPSVPPPTPALLSKDELLAKMMAGIQDFEGWYPPSDKWPQGSPAFRHNNPGNLMDNTGKELQFPTYQDGVNALKAYLVRAASGKHPAYKPTMTLMKFFHTYTGDPEPSPTNYANYVALRMGVDSEIWTISNLV